MPRFFTECPPMEGTKLIDIVGDDAHHGIHVLRLRPGEKLTVCDGRGKDFFCQVEDVSQGTLRLRVLSAKANRAEPSVRCTLFQSLLKGDKLEEIIWRAVEFGVYRVVPMTTARCVVRQTPVQFEKKLQRLQKIAAEAAKQCGRGIMPEILPLHSFQTALRTLAEMERSALFYEDSGISLRNLMEQGVFGEFGFLIGPEGGFEPDEVKAAAAVGIPVVNMGARIMRAQTASAGVLAALMYATDNF
jgi:16S rRNA (uracil1498-N3)-methyltransferase